MLLAAGNPSISDPGVLADRFGTVGEGHIRRTSKQEVVSMSERSIIVNAVLDHQSPNISQATSVKTTSVTADLDPIRNVIK